MKHIDLLIGNYPALKNIKTDIENATKLLISSFESSGMLLLCGNGGSAADCEHISGELLKGFLKKRELSSEDKMKFDDKNISTKLQYGLPCIPLTSLTSLSTAVANDNSADMIFAQSAYVFAKEDDVLLALSTSGNSRNIVNAVIAAKAKGAKIISITGANDSKLSEISDVTIKIPETETYRIQEYTLPVYHAICAQIEYHFYA